MRAGALIPVDEYLSSHFDPDCDYLAGEIEERNVGEKDHSRLQGLLYGYLLQREKPWGIRTYPEQRVQVRPDRFRVPDICVILGKAPSEQIFANPPFLCVEILSPADTVQKMMTRIQDYLDFGVPYVWLVDPASRRGWIWTRQGMTEAADGILRTANPDLGVPLAELFDED